MKYILSIAIFLFSAKCFSQKYNWVYACASKAGDEWYIEDKSTPTAYDNIVGVWAKEYQPSYVGDDGHTYKNTVAYLELDLNLTQGEYCIRSVRGYYKGKVIHTFNVHGWGTWMPVIPESAMEGVLDKARELFKTK
jgi:hypothetical protein